MRIAEHIVVVGSGKGGVGKSTIAVNLAVALAGEGVSVGILDADLYGPSLPIMLGLRGLSPRVSQENEKERIIPFTKFGVQAISLGCFLEEARSILWRGPMLHGALEKMLVQVAWGNLDVLIIDLPPGTGDVIISLTKLLKIRSAIAVTTPQEVAIIDVIKAIDAFDQLGVPLCGVVENMASFVSETGENYSLFGEGKGGVLAGHLGVPLLQSIPLLIPIREGGDSGIPPAFHQQTPAGHHFRELARNFLSVLK